MKFPWCRKLEWCFPFIENRLVKTRSSLIIMNSVISLALEYRTMISFSRRVINSSYPCKTPLASWILDVEAWSMSGFYLLVSMTFLLINFFLPFFDYGTLNPLITLRLVSISVITDSYITALPLTFRIPSSISVCIRIISSGDSRINASFEVVASK